MGDNNSATQTPIPADSYNNTHVPDIIINYAGATKDTDTALCSTTNDTVSNSAPLDPTAVDHASEESQLFTMDSDMQKSLEQLLQAASTRDSSRVTRSQGMNIHWNPTMNPDDVINFEND